MSLVESILVSAASLVAVLAGLVAFTRFITRRFTGAVEDVVTAQVADLKQQLTVEFSGNGGGAREAINDLHVKVDDGFARAHRERDELLDRVNVLETERAQRVTNETSPKENP